MSPGERTPILERRTSRVALFAAVALGPRAAAAVRYAIAHGVLVVAAAGDDYANRPEYPAALLGSAGLAVAAVMRSGFGVIDVASAVARAHSLR
jgi:subtilisin family serine protease